MYDNYILLNFEDDPTINSQLESAMENDSQLI
jgi:hypothetical protein